jgi:pilus assembly protein CpaE
MAIFFEPDADTVALLVKAVGGDPATDVVSVEEALPLLLDTRPEESLVIVGPHVEPEAAFRLASSWRVQRPALGVVLVRRRVDSLVLGQALRAGVREVVRLEPASGLAEACNRAQLVAQDVATHARQAAADCSARGQLITVFSAKGGCGKTTVASNVAAMAAAGGTRVCLVDLDLPFGDVAISLQLGVDRTLADSIPMAGHIDEMGVRSIVTAHPSGLDVLIAPIGPGEAERITPALVNDLLAQLKRMYDVVVVDTPPAFTEQVLAALDATDVFLLLATPDVPAVKNLKLTLEMLQMLGYSPDAQHVVLNRADAKVGLSLPEIEKALQRKILTQVPSSRDVPASVNRGVPLGLEQPRHPVSAALRTLVDAVARVPHTVEVAPRVARHGRRRSFLRRTEATA